MYCGVFIDQEFPRHRISVMQEDTRTGIPGLSEDTGAVGHRSGGTQEQWDTGVVGHRSSGTQEQWDTGAVGHRSSGTQE